MEKIKIGFLLIVVFNSLFAKDLSFSKDTVFSLSSGYQSENERTQVKLKNSSATFVQFDSLYIWYIPQYRSRLTAQNIDISFKISPEDTAVHGTIYNLVGAFPLNDSIFFSREYYYKSGSFNGQIGIKANDSLIFKDFIFGACIWCTGGGSGTGTIDTNAEVFAKLIFRSHSANISDTLNIRGNPNWGVNAVVLPNQAHREFINLDILNNKVYDVAGRKMFSRESFDKITLQNKKRSTLSPELIEK